MLNVSVILVTVSVFLLSIGAVGDIIPWIEKSIATTKVSRTQEKPTVEIQPQTETSTANFQGAEGQANKDSDASGQLR